MYATVIWSIDPRANDSAAINARVDQAFGTLTTTQLQANIRIARLRSVADLGTLGGRFDAIRGDFPAEFDFVCVGSAGGTPLSPANRPFWDANAVRTIIAEDG